MEEVDRQLVQHEQQRGDDHVATNSEDDLGATSAILGKICAHQDGRAVSQRTMATAQAR